MRKNFRIHLSQGMSTIKFAQIIISRALYTSFKVYEKTFEKPQVLYNKHQSHFSAHKSPSLRDELKGYGWQHTSWTGQHVLSNSTLFRKFVQLKKRKFKVFPFIARMVWCSIRTERLGFLHYQYQLMYKGISKKKSQDSRRRCQYGKLVHDV